MRSVTTVTNKTWNPSFIPKRASEAPLHRSYLSYFIFYFSLLFPFFLLLSFFLPLSPSPPLPPSALCPVCDIHEVWVSTLFDICGTHLRENAGDRRCPENVRTIWLHESGPSFFFFLFQSFPSFSCPTKWGRFSFTPSFAHLFTHFSPTASPNSQISQRTVWWILKSLEGITDSEPNTHAPGMNVDVIHYLTTIHLQLYNFVECLLGDNETLPD